MSVYPRLDVPTLTLSTSVVYAAQAIIVLCLCRTDMKFRGRGCWLAGLSLEAVGFLLMPLLLVKSVWMLSLLANPMVVAGRILLYVAILRFLGKDENRWTLLALFLAFVIPYYYFCFGTQSITARSILIYCASALIAAVMALELARGKVKSFAISAGFSVFFFALGAVSHLAMAVMMACLPHLVTYSDYYSVPIRAVVFLLPAFTSVLWLYGFIMMVMERMGAENREEKEKWQRVFSMSPDAKVVVRVADGAVLDLNDGFLPVFGYRREEIIGRTVTQADFWADMEDFRRFIGGIEERGSVDNTETAFRRKDGSSMTGNVSARVIPIDGEPHLLCVVQDITQRKRVEREVQRLLAEKELLLKEVHHRIKNNMNTMYSMISLQASSLEDPASAAALEDAKSRLLSMGNLYDTLYKTSSFSELSMRTYLPPLVDRIVANFPAAHSVTMEKHIEDFILGVEKLQPLGIIVNELLTNAMKYAFTGIADAKLEVSASLRGERVIVSVRDNGVGLPEDLDPEESPGFGFTLIYALAEQLRGTFRIDRSGGAAGVLEFDR